MGGLARKRTGTMLGRGQWRPADWENRTLNWTYLRDELKLSYTPETLATRLKQKGYYCYTAYQKPYLTTAQVLRQLLWLIIYIFWYLE